MVEKDPGNEDGPSLELPKLGFGFLRRRKQDDKPKAETEAGPEAEAGPETKAAPDPDPDPDTIFDEDEDEQLAKAAREDEFPERAVEPAEAVPAVEEPELAEIPPAADTPVVASPAEDLADEEPASEESTDDAPAEEPDVEDSAATDGKLGIGRWRKRRSPKAAAEVPESEPVAPAEDAVELSKPEPAPIEEPEAPAGDPDTEATTVLTDVPETDASEPTEVLPGFSAAEPAAEADADADAEGEKAPAAKAKRSVSLPRLSGLTAAAVTGVAVGLLAVLLTFLALRGCEQVQGTSSCGGPGVFLLIAIMVACILAGRFLLAAWNVSDAGSTSFLAVGLLAVIALLFLVNVLFEWWMIILIPLIGLCTFMLSHWVTVALIDPADR